MKFSKLLSISILLSSYGFSATGSRTATFSTTQTGGGGEWKSPPTSQNFYISRQTNPFETKEGTRSNGSMNISGSHGGGFSGSTVDGSSSFTLDVPTVETGQENMYGGYTLSSDRNFQVHSGTWTTSVVGQDGTPYTYNMSETLSYTPDGIPVRTITATDPATGESYTNQITVDPTTDQLYMTGYRGATVSATGSPKDNASVVVYTPDGRSYTATRTYSKDGENETQEIDRTTAGGYTFDSTKSNSGVPNVTQTQTWSY